MIEIDGEYGSGGGQVLRTAVGLSALTGKPCRVTNVRAKRANPGLREQHLQAIRAVAAFCNGTVKGASIGSPEIEFRPGDAVLEKVQVNIGTAGSVGLVLQALLIPATASGLDVSISGGATYGKWAVPVSYLQTVLCPILERAGYAVNIRVQKEGFYPKGGAAVRTAAVASRISPIEITDKGELIAVRGVSVASSSLKRAQVADRQAKSAAKLLSAHFGVKPDIEVRYADAICPGSGIQLWAETAHSVIGGNALGERGKRSEDVGEEAARMLIEEFEGGAVDCRAADQLLPYMALAGGEITTSRITNHCRTNAFVVEHFLPARFTFDGNTIRVSKREHS
jgi:RNA 3'-terminal phosphate cyclase (ATP)/RNA 3'-terminal phosphate cyclase (GTP)